MSRRSWSWCWVAVLLLWLVPAGAAHAMTVIKLNYSERPCVREPGQSWEQESPNGRFKLEVTMRQGTSAVPPLYEIKLFRGGKPAWNMVLKDLIAKPYTWLAADGRYVVMLRPDGQLMVLNADGGLVRTWELFTELSLSEKARFPKDLCQDVSWSYKARFTGDFFELEVPPTQVLGQSHAPYKPVLIRIDLKALNLTRDRPVVSGEDTQLIQAFEAAKDPEERLRLTDELLGRSQMREHLKSQSLSAFWNKLLLTPEVTPTVLHRLAVEAVAAYGLDSEVRALTRMPGEFEERDIAVLDVLARRSPEDAGEYAVRVLDTRHPASGVRRRALELLMQVTTARDMAVEFALRDSEPELRRMALSPLASPPHTAARFERVLGFCADPGVTTQFDMEHFALHTLNRVEADKREALIAALRRAEARFTPGQCPKLSMALGVLTDKQGDRARAVELYTRGLRSFEAQGKKARTTFPGLVLETTLQLALEAEKKGERAEAERYARKVLADSSRRTLVCAPAPMELEALRQPTPCIPARKAEQVARDLLKRLKSKPRGG